MEEVLSSETNENTVWAGWILLASQLSMRYKHSHFQRRLNGGFYISAPAPRRNF